MREAVRRLRSCSPGAPGKVPQAEIDELSNIPEKEIFEPAQEYARLNEEMLTQSGRKNEQMTGLLTGVFLAVGLCGAIGGLLGGWVIATGVRRAMMRTEDRLRGTAVRMSAVVPAGRSVGDAAEWVDESVSALLDRFRQVERDALRAEQLAWMGQMAAGVAHEIRNPLMAIKILVQAAADPLRETPFRTKDLTVIEREIGRLEHTVTGFLDFARPPQPEKHTVDLRTLLEDAVATLRGGPTDSEFLSMSRFLPRRSPCWSIRISSAKLCSTCSTTPWTRNCAAVASRSRLRPKRVRGPANRNWSCESKTKGQGCRSMSATGSSIRLLAPRTPDSDWAFRSAAGSWRTTVEQSALRRGRRAVRSLPFSFRSEPWLNPFR